MNRHSNFLSSNANQEASNEEIKKQMNANLEEELKQFAEEQKESPPQELSPEEYERLARINENLI